MENGVCIQTCPTGKFGYVYLSSSDKSEISLSQTCQFCPDGCTKCLGFSID